MLSIQFGMWYLYAAAITRAPVDHEEIVEIGELARRALRARPDQAASKIAMGLAELLDERPKRARSVLAEVPASDGDLYDVALLLRAAAGDPLPEEAGGRHPELSRLVAAVRDAGPGLAMSQRTPRRQGPVIAAVNPLPSRRVAVDVHEQRLPVRAEAGAGQLAGAEAVDQELERASRRGSGR